MIKAEVISVSKPITYAAPSGNTTKLALCTLRDTDGHEFNAILCDALVPKLFAGDVCAVIQWTRKDGNVDHVITKKLGDTDDVD